MQNASSLPAYVLLVSKGWSNSKVWVHEVVFQTSLYKGAMDFSKTQVPQATLMAKGEWALIQILWWCHSSFMPSSIWYGHTLSEGHHQKHWEVAWSRCMRLKIIFSSTLAYTVEATDVYLWTPGWLEVGVCRSCCVPSWSCLRVSHSASVSVRLFHYEFCAIVLAAFFPR